MSNGGRVRVYIAMSLDGFIAGPDDDLSWLDSWSSPSAASEPAGDSLSYKDFIKDVGALLMGRRTYDVVRGMDVPWPYDLPVMVATRRELDSPPEKVQSTQGTIEACLSDAREAAAGKDVYIDGGDLIRQALEKGAIDELVITLIPTILGAGRPLFAGTTVPQTLELVRTAAYPGGAVQLFLRPRSR